MASIISSPTSYSLAASRIFVSFVLVLLLFFLRLQLMPFLLFKRKAQLYSISVSSLFLFFLCSLPSLLYFQHLRNHIVPLSLSSSFLSSSSCYSSSYIDSSFITSGFWSSSSSLPFFPAFVSADPLSSSSSRPFLSNENPAIFKGICNLSYINPCVREAVCQPTVPIIGEAICKCPDGFSGDGRLPSKGGEGCVNIDECSSSKHSCNLMTETCIDLPGSYQCLCLKGFAKAPDDSTCLDIDECAQPGLNECDLRYTECRNTEGSYKCLCRDASKTLDPLTGICRDLNECEDMGGVMNPCQQVCHDKLGGVECGCHAGYELQSDHISCLDIDECATGQHSCDPTGKISRCANTEGSYNCFCNPELGYKTAKDKKSCENLNECQEHPYICGGASSCCMDLLPPQRFACMLPAPSRRIDSLPSTPFTASAILADRNPFATPNGFPLGSYVSPQLSQLGIGGGGMGLLEGFASSSASYPESPLSSSYPSYVGAGGSTIPPHLRKQQIVNGISSPSSFTPPSSLSLSSPPSLSPPPSSLSPSSLSPPSSFTPPPSLSSPPSSLSPLLSSVTPPPLSPPPSLIPSLLSSLSPPPSLSSSPSSITSVSSSLTPSSLLSSSLTSLSSPSLSRKILFSDIPLNNSSNNRKSSSSDPNFNSNSSHLYSGNGSGSSLSTPYNLIGSTSSNATTTVTTTIGDLHYEELWCFESDVELIQMDDFDFPVVVDSVFDCQLRCKNHHKCGSFSFNQNESGQCFLKGLDYGRRRVKGFVSGPRDCNWISDLPSHTTVDVASISGNAEEDVKKEDVIISGNGLSDDYHKIHKLLVKPKSQTSDTTMMKTNFVVASLEDGDQNPRNLMIEEEVQKKYRGREEEWEGKEKEIKVLGLSSSRKREENDEGEGGGVEEEFAEMEKEEEFVMIIANQFSIREVHEQLVQKLEDREGRKLFASLPSYSSSSSRRRLQLLSALRYGASSRLSGRGGLASAMMLQCPNGFHSGADLQRSRLRQQTRKSLQNAFGEGGENGGGTYRMTPELITEGLIKNTNAIANEVAHWYKEFSSVPGELAAVTSSVVERDKIGAQAAAPMVNTDENNAGSLPFSSFAAAAQKRQELTSGLKDIF